MRTRLRRAIALTSLIAIQPMGAIYSQTPPGTADETYPANSSSETKTTTPLQHKLPPSHHTYQVNWYPASAIRSHQQGRVLVEFRIAANGQVVAPHVLQTDAASVLQQQALKLMQQTSFDISESGSDASNDTPFRATIRFCLRPCTPLEAYPGSELITITGASIP
jgi:TonB family protein